MLVGNVLRHTISPIVSRLMWPLLMSKIFGPRSVPKKSEGFPKEMALRPLQIRASTGDSALMIWEAFYLQHEYAKLKMPVVIIAGDKDGLINIDAQSGRLHRDLPRADFTAFSKRPHNPSDCERRSDGSNQRSEGQGEMRRKCQGYVGY